MSVCECECVSVSVCRRGTAECSETAVNATNDFLST